MIATSVGPEPIPSLVLEPAAQALADALAAGGDPPLYTLPPIKRPTPVRRPPPVGGSARRRRLLPLPCGRW
jgi:hypothetical protein